MAYETIKVETRDAVGLITLHRPDALNALNQKLIAEVNDALDGFEKNDAIGAIVLTGSEKAFAAGADIKEMAGRSFVECYTKNMFKNWGDVAAINKPVSDIAIIIIVIIVIILLLLFVIIVIAIFFYLLFLLLVLQILIKLI